MLVISYLSEQFKLNFLKEREEDFLREIVGISVKQIYDKLHHDTLTFGTHFIQRNDFKQAFKSAGKNQNNRPLIDILQDPFISGYVNAANVSIESLRAYDSNWHLLAEGRVSGYMTTEDHQITTQNIVMASASKRKGKNQLKSLGGRWGSQEGAFYSVIIPIGGIRIKGFIEIVANANINLPKLEQLLGHKINITNLITKKEIHSAQPEEDGINLYKNNHEISYTILSLDKKPLYLINIFVPSNKFMAKIKSNQHKTILYGALLNFSIVLIVLIILKSLLITPMHRLRNDIHKQIKSLSGKPVSTHGLQEFYDLAIDFNHLIKVVKSQNDMLEQLSTLDSLTQLPNRRALDDFIVKAQHRAQRADEYLTVIMMDIDHFKQYNDTYGHKKGDECLKAVADAIKQPLKRSTDFAARYGGEEFIVVLSDTDIAGSTKIAQDVLNSVRAKNIPHKASQVSDIVTLSLGLAICEKGKHKCLETLIEQADSNLYIAKHNGRNQVYPTENILNKNDS